MASLTKVLVNLRQNSFITLTTAVACLLMVFFFQAQLWGAVFEAEVAEGDGRSEGAHFRLRRGSNPGGQRNESSILGGKIFIFSLSLSHYLSNFLFFPLFQRYLSFLILLKLPILSFFLFLLFLSLFSLCLFPFI